MPRNPALPLLKCDICSLTTRNHFIYKRHRKRCIREMGTPAQISAEHEFSTEISGDEEMFENAEEVFEETANDNSSPDGPEELEERPFVSYNMNPKAEDTLVPSSTTSLPETSDDKMISKPQRKSLSDLDTSTLDQAEATRKSSTSSSKIETDMPKSQNTEPTMDTGDKEQRETISKPNSKLALPPVNRNYRCFPCSFATTKSRDFLLHKIQQHNAHIYIFTCTYCEYASQYKHKLARHMGQTHNVYPKNDEIFPEHAPPGYDGRLGPSKKRLLGTGKPGKPNKVVSSKAASKSVRSVDSLLVKLKAKSKVMESSLSSFFTSTSGQADEGATAEGDLLYKCKLCLFTANSKSKVTRHLHACHINAQLFRCNLCSYKTYSKIEFYAHKKKHTNKHTTMFKCAECAYTTEFRPNFDRHMLHHGCNKPNKCSLCSYATDHEGALKRHVTSHHPNTEQNCSLVIAGDEATGTKSSDGIDDDENDGREPEAEEGLGFEGFRCPICALQYRRCPDLNRHMKSKHNMSRKEFIDCNNEGDDEVLEMDDEEFTEAMDAEEVSGSDDSEDGQPLSELAKGKQPTAQKINKKCSYCSYIAKWPSDLRRHMRVHSVVKRFKCSLCWKKYKYLGDLSVHMRRDHEVNPDQDLTPQKVSTIATKKSSPKLFRCPACPFYTKVKVDMDRHSHSHTEEKTYKCKLCKYQTYWRGDMGRHLYRKHPQEVSREKDVDVKQFFIFRPDRRAISKGGRGLSSDMVHGLEDLPEEPEVGQQTMEKSQMEAGNEDSISDTISMSDSLSNCSEATVDKSGNKIYKCNLCTFSNSQAYKMKNHMDMHRNLKQYKCPVCGQRSNWKYDTRKHISSKHPDCTEDVIVLPLEEAKATIQEYLENMSKYVKREYTANTGAAKFIQTPSPQTPSTRDKGKKNYEYKCSHCPYSSWYRNSIIKHQTDSHANQSGVGILAKPISVPEVDQQQDADTKDFTTIEETKLVSSESMDIDEDGEHMDGSPTLYRCAECGKEGSSKGSIKKHYNYIHPECEVRIISVADGVEFNYYTGLPTNSSTLLSDENLPNKEQGSVSSKLSDPKKFGYVKPFKCSVCGQRSNWKWDIKKHLRAKHPNDFGHVVVLQLEQARATCPKRNRPSQMNAGNLNSSSTPEKDITNILQESGSSVSPSMMNKSQEMLLGRYRRYKCSACGYRSNWRTDICRHIERLHKEDNAQVIFMDVEEAKKTFMDYSYFPPNANSHPPGVSSPASSKLPSASKSQSQSRTSNRMPPVTGKVWHCLKCSFMSAVKSHIVAHMQSHGMKPFHCSACGQTSRFRSPLYRHIRKQHKSSDYSTYAKIIIKFTKPSDQAQSPGRHMATEKLVDAFLCRLCSVNTVEASTKEEMMTHILSEHGSTDEKQVLQIRKLPGMDANGEADSEEAAKAGRGKRYFCIICPYRTDRRGMLTFHHLSHQPSSQKKYKCKFCPYYVCAPRLLHQHMKWHEEWMDDQPSVDSGAWRGGTEKTPPSSPSKKGKVLLESPKRHNCEKCPYTTNSKNDFIYHKQFHRPKATAQYKCEYCDYWVQQKRLLKQHLRLHDEDYSPESMTSPSKSIGSDASAVIDAVEIAAIKQKMISNKITASLSTSPAVSPMKMASQCTVGNKTKKPGFILRDGVYKKLHKCSKCPYTNIRSRNVRFHELMHGWRRSDHLLMKCPHCDYYVGAKGLLSHHMKVHNQQYCPDPLESTTFDLEKKEKAPGMSNFPTEADDEKRNTFASHDISQKQKVDALLEISRFKKYSCEKCPFASSKRSNFLRHMELHGSRQRYTCHYCDYSVPSVTLLMQHQKIHLMPNQNLLATQSFSNLQHLKEVPADVALASALPPSDISESVTISVIHDHLDLYENNENNSLAFPVDHEGTHNTPKLFRCDQCPYANVNRSYLLNHHQYHRNRSVFNCPYCNYSVPRHQFLTQHLRVHFCPLPELSDWLIENGQNERAEEVNDIDHKLAQALVVAERYQTTSKRKVTTNMNSPQNKDDDKGDETDDVPAAKKSKVDDGDGKSSKAGPQKAEAVSGEAGKQPEPIPSTSAAADMAEKTGEGNSSPESNLYICQYCDREFPSSKPLVAHEFQHLIGNHFESAQIVPVRVQPAQPRSTTKTTEGEENREHVAATITTTTTTLTTSVATRKVFDDRKEEVIDLDAQESDESDDDDVIIIEEVKQESEEGKDETIKKENTKEGEELGTRQDAVVSKEVKQDHNKCQESATGSSPQKWKTENSTIPDRSRSDPDKTKNMSDEYIPM